MSRAQKLTIVAPDLPDLQVRNVSANVATAEEGEVIEASWTIFNDGKKAATGRWLDEVFLQRVDTPTDMRSLGNI